MYTIQCYGFQNGSPGSTQHRVLYDYTYGQNPMRLSIRVLCGIVAAVALGAVANAQQLSGGGPPGGNVWSVVIDPRNPSTVYAASGGVFKSIDGGATWTLASAGLTGPRPPVLALAIDPSNSAVLYAGTDRGVFKSSNGGQTWVPSVVRHTD